MSPVAEVHYISTETIKPATHTDSTQRFDLTPWDLNLLAVHAIQKGLLFFKPDQSKQDTWINLLKSSLSRTLDSFFPLAGRLATEEDNNNTISVFIQCNNAGAELVHATVNLTVSDILDPLYVPHIVQDFFSLNRTINYDGRFHPLLSIQVTELIDGIFIGCTMNHMIADGTSFWHFINSWSELCRGGGNNSNQISHTPNLNRLFFNGTDIPIRLSLSTIQRFIRPYNMPPLEDRVFHFAPQNIAKLKAKANEEIKTNNISSLQAILAHVWRAVTRARKLDFDQEISYNLLMGNRGRLNPPLPEGYFGNSVIRGSAETKAGALMENGLGWAAGLLNEVVNLHSNAEICNHWENWLKEPVMIYFDELVSKPILITGSSPRFNMYGNDFGWGCPIGVRSGCGNKFDGKMTVFPGAVEGSMEIEACLLPPTLKALGEDSEFMEVVGVEG